MSKTQAQSPSTASLRLLRSFGDVAAETDPVLEYFLKTSSVGEIIDEKKFLVVGRKGAGKTAIVRFFTEGKQESLSKALNLRSYPWNVHAQRIDRGASDIEAYVSSWRYIIAVEIASFVIKNCPIAHLDDKKNLDSFLRNNYGGVNPNLGDLLRPRRLQIGKFSLQPSVLGNQIGSVDLDRKSSDLNFGTELNALTDSIVASSINVYRSQLKKDMYIHFDELDHGLEVLDDKRRRMLIGLILAARELRGSFQKSGASIFPVVYLRTDIWDDLSFSDKNKTTQSQMLLLEWDKETLRDLVEVRLSARLHPNTTFGDIIDGQLMRGSQPKWNHIVARTLRRPRDVIQFLNISLRIANKRNDDPLLFTNKDIVDSRADYSTYLKKELDDEIKPHWPDWDQALQACSSIATETFSKSEFVEKYSVHKTRSNPIEHDTALRLLHRFSVIGYERRSGYGGSGWSFLFEEPDAGWDSAATKFKVHPGLKEYAKLREKRQ